MFGFLDFAAFKDPRFTLFAFGAWSIMFSVFNPYFYISVYSTLVNGPSELATYLLSIIYKLSIFGRILPGLIADKWGRYVTFDNIFDYS